MIVAMVVLVVAFLSQTALLAVLIRAGSEERRRFLHAIVTGTPAEYVAVERAVTAKPRKTKKRDETVPAHPIGL